MLLQPLQLERRMARRPLVTGVTLNYLEQGDERGDARFCRMIGPIRGIPTHVYYRTGPHAVGRSRRAFPRSDQETLIRLISKASLLIYEQTGHSLQ